MEHTIVEHTLEYPEAHKGEVVLHCMSCDDWVSTQDTEEVIAEFRNAPCPGPRQHGPEFPYEDNDEILPTTSGVPTIEDRLDAVDDAIRSVPGLENVGKPKDPGGPLYKDNFYSHPDFKKKEDRT